MKASMSRTGNCYDNAPMESFFHTLKVELVHQRRWATRDEARRDLFSYVEGYYNRQRMHSALGYLSPEQAEQNVASQPRPLKRGKISPPHAPRPREAAHPCRSGYGAYALSLLACVIALRAPF